MAKSAAERMQALRTRRAMQREGWALWQATAKLVRLTEALIEDGFLDECDAEDRAAAEKAFQKMVEVFQFAALGPEPDLDEDVTDVTA